VAVLALMPVAMTAVLFLPARAMPVAVVAVASVAFVSFLAFVPFVPMPVVAVAFVVVAMVAVPVVVCSWPCPAPAATRLSGSSFIPHLGQRSGLSLVTSGCIGQT